MGKMSTASGLATTPWMWFMQKASRSRLFSEKLKLELYPPFFLMRVKVLEISPCWRKIRMKLPLNTISRNPGGVMFGGYQAALGDPIAALACSRIFPEYGVWTRAMTVDFQVGGSKDLELKFEMTAEMEDSIRKELQKKGRATPTFTYGFYLPDGTMATLVTNTVAIRPLGYWKASSPSVQQEFKPASQLSKLENKLRETILDRLVSKYLAGEKLLAVSFEDLLHDAADEEGNIYLEKWHDLFTISGINEKFSKEEVDALFDLLDGRQLGCITVENATSWWKKGKDNEATK